MGRLVTRLDWAEDGWERKRRGGRKQERECVCECVCVRERKRERAYLALFQPTTCCPTFKI